MTNVKTLNPQVWCPSAYHFAGPDHKPALYMLRLPGARATYQRQSERTVYRRAPWFVYSPPRLQTKKVWRCASRMSPTHGSQQHRIPGEARSPYCTLRKLRSAWAVPGPISCAPYCAWFNSPLDPTINSANASWLLSSFQ